MNSKEWFGSLKNSPELSGIIPAAVQPSLPLPVLDSGKLLIYVPFYIISPAPDGLCCSGKVCEAYFTPDSRRMIYFSDLAALGKTEAKLGKAMPFPGENRLRQNALDSEQLLITLDNILKEYLSGQDSITEKIEEYKDFLLDILLFPTLSKLYED